MPLADEVVELLNGQLYANNETGETELSIQAYTVPIRTTAPDAASQNVFIEDIDDITSAPRNTIQFNEVAVSTFLTDQVTYLRGTCNIQAAELADAALFEVAYLRLLAYRMRLINANLRVGDFHVRYNNAKSSNPAAAGTVTNALENHAQRDAYRGLVRDWSNGNQAHVQFIVANFSNIVCTVAYVFRQKGHHYVTGPDYQEAYTKLWNKVNRSNRALHAAWETIATIGLHAIMPKILDQFYRFCSAQGRIAAPLALRVNVPCAGTAAPFALLVGWEDARSAYGLLLTDHQEAYDRLHQLVAFCKNNRWAHGVNSGFYGIPCVRLDLAPFSAMAATVAGVYEAAAERATLLQSKSLQREASGSPLQRDIAQLAARALREVFVNRLAKGSSAPAAIKSN